MLKTEFPVDNNIHIRASRRHKGRTHKVYEGTRSGQQERKSKTVAKRYFINKKIKINGLASVLPVYTDIIIIRGLMRGNYLFSVFAKQKHALMLNSGCFIKNYERVKIFNEGVNLTSKKQWRVTCLKVGSTCL